jgi:hypothetical protein
MFQRSIHKVTTAHSILVDESHIHQGEGHRAFCREAALELIDYFSALIIWQRKVRPEITRWRLEGGSRKRASYSEILERRWRHTLQA